MFKESSCNCVKIVKVNDVSEKQFYVLQFCFIYSSFLLRFSFYNVTRRSV